MTTTTTSNQAPPSHVINFGCGHPDPSLLPLAEVAAATQRALQDDGDSAEWLQYARENGNPRARQALANFLTHLYYTTTTTSRSAKVDPDTLCITSGVSHGIQLTCRTLWRMHQKQYDCSESPLALVEDPTYFLVPAIFQQSGYEIRATPTTAAQGLDVRALETTFQQVRAASPHRLIVLYTIPVHHNPLGVTLSARNRQELVQVCEQYTVFVIADEVYQGLGFTSVTDDDDGDDDDTRGTTSMVSPTACSDKIVSVSAFTKILCPGIRCGWIQTHNRALLAEIGKDAVLDSGGCSSQLSSGIVTNMIQTTADDDEASSVALSPLVSYMTSLQTEYAKRCHIVCQLLQASSQTNDFGFEFCHPQGGYFLWVTLTGADFVVDEAFRGFCLAQYHVDFKTGRSCSSATWQDEEALAKEQDERFSHSMRLCFAYYDVPKLTQGVERLCEAIQDYSKNPQRTLSKCR